MKSPINGKEMVRFKEPRKLTYRKEEFSFIFHGYRCVDSKQQFTTTALGNVNLFQIYNQYREKYNLPFPDEIKAIRKKYELSALKMSKILGFGVNVYRNYENGEVPNLSNGKLIRLIDKPKQFKTLVQLSNGLKEKAKIKLLHKIDTLLEKESAPVFGNFTNAYLPGELSGYKTFDEHKFTEMVIYFAKQIKPWKTQLNKLLFYADFLMFSKHCTSISGIRYRAINMGPVPQNYNTLFEQLANQNSIDIKSIAFANGAIGEQFYLKADQQLNTTVFTETEFTILQLVVKKFKPFNTQQLIDYSHKEKAWLENRDEKKLISYRFAFDLNDF